ncbi:hypothetical protein ACHAQA_004277 [Verticillium albo-atrum]
MSAEAASARIPIVAANRVSQKARETLDEVERFVNEKCIPADAVFAQSLGRDSRDRFAAHPQVLEDLKTEARRRGLWNLFLAKGHYGESSAFSNLEYGLMAEQLGRSQIASEVMNCSAPDTGNMEVLAKFGNQDQKQEWLRPLLDGKIRSAFLMTEPDVASSDATNIEFSMQKDGDEYVLNGSKWWSSGAGDPRCELYIVMGKTDPENSSPHRQQSVFLVPSRTPGITVHRMLSVFGYDDAPHGHGHISFENAERAVELVISRIHDPKKRPFEIDASRLVVLNAAIKIDEGNAKVALKEIAEAKILVPEMLSRVLDGAIQVYGGAGVSQDTPLAQMWANARTMRLVDGPDEVHMLQLGRRESRRADATRTLLAQQKALEAEVFKKYNMIKLDSLHMGWTSETKPKL